MKLKAALAVALLSVCWLILSSAFGGSEKWEGFVYYDKSDLSLYQEIGAFETLEACRASSNAKMHEWGTPHVSTYECASNCRVDDHSDLRICEKVSR